MEFVIDEELQALIPPLSKVEFEQLEQDILEYGCLAPLIVWPVPDSDEIILLDGHNRFKICSEHNVSYKTESISLIDRAAAINWMIMSQFGRRNLTAKQVSYLRGKQYEQEKQRISNPGGIGGKSGKIVKPQNEVQQSMTTSGKFAKQHGVSKATIERDAYYARAVDAIAAATAPEVQQQLLSVDSKLSKSATLKLAEQRPTIIASIIEEIRGCKNKTSANAVVSRFTDQPGVKELEEKELEEEDPCEIENPTDALDLMSERFTETQIKEAVSQYFTEKKED